MKKLALTLWTVLTLASAFAVTKVEFWFDTEDYTYEPSMDCMREIANILTEEGVRGQFNIVGYLAQRMSELNRQDVIQALRPHCLGTQTMWHSRHPVLGEYSDIADYDEAYARCMREEAVCAGLVRGVFGLDRLLFAVQPGIHHVYSAFDVYADLGIPSGVVYDFDDGRRGLHWYCNQLMVQYNVGKYGLGFEELLKDECTVEKFLEPLDRVTGYARITIAMHPHRAIKRTFWDIENYLEGNLVEFGHWKKPALWDASVTKRFYERFRLVVRAIKNDPRFEVDDWEQVLAAVKPRVPITQADVPAIRTALNKRLVPMEHPASWCIADCFQAAVRLLRGEKESVPGKVYGFLDFPEGVTHPVRIKAGDLRAAARRIEFKRHLPTSYEVGGTRIGPADFLFAALEVLETGADEVTVVPRNQLGDIENFAPGLAAFKHKGAWPIFTPEFKDRYLSDRLRYQFWTFRYE